MYELTTDKLTELISKRYRCLTQLRDLGQKQSALIEAGDMNTLLRLISAKNQLIVALQSIEQGLTPFHSQEPEQRHWHSEQARMDCAKVADACQQLLQEVMELEHRNEQTMTARRNQVAEQLQAAQAAGNARGAYLAHQLSPTQGPHQTRPAPILNTVDYPHGQQLDLQSDS